MRVGVIGTMVWDRIHARDGRSAPVEEWGGICYALAAAVAASPPEWTIRPIMKVGRDVQESAYRFLRELEILELEPGVRIVPEPNNRVELRYQDADRRCERLTGGVPPWRIEELEPLLDGVDALYVNFISGFEMELETVQRLRLAFRGPIYADLHSLMLGIAHDGMRVPRPLESWREWLRCFDVMQLNEDELGVLASAWGDPWRLAAEVVGPELRALLVTLGRRGAAYVASPAFRPDPLSWHPSGITAAPRIGTRGAVRSERIPLPLEAVTEEPDADPTGCGDVWGATAWLHLLSGEGLAEAVRAANAAAARNARHRGTTGLHHHLRGRIHT